MTYKTCFKINISGISDNEMYEIIDMLGPEPGITESFLYYGLLQRDTEEENFTLFELLNDTLSIIYPKKELLKKLTNIYPISYMVDVRFSDLEEEMERNTSMTITEESKDFIRAVGAYYFINNEWIDL